MYKYVTTNPAIRYNYNVLMKNKEDLKKKKKGISRKDQDLSKLNKPTKSYPICYQEEEVGNRPIYMLQQQFTIF